MNRVKGILVALSSVCLCFACTGLAPLYIDADSPAAGEPKAGPLAVLAPGKNTSISIYQDNIAVVRDLRRIQLASGECFFGVTDIPRDIDASSVSLRFLPATTSGPVPVVLSYHIENNMLSRTALLRAYVGKEIEISQGDGSTYRCILVSLSGDGIIVRKDNSLILNPPGTLILPLSSGELLSPNCLKFHVNSPTPGTMEAELSYKTGGFSWSANYFGLLDKNDTRLILSGWATISNMTDLSYMDAKVNLVAGDIRVSRTGGVQQSKAALPALAMATSEAALPLPEEAPLFEYHSFAVPRLLSLPARTSKHVQLMAARDLPVKKVFVFEGPSYGGVEPFTGMKQSLAANVVLESSNTGSDAGPLPRGKISIYRRDAAGIPELVGEDVIPETARDEKIKLVVGRAFDVVGDKTVTDYRRVSPRSYEEACSIKLRNRKDEDVEVVVLQRFSGDWTLSSPLPYKKTDASTAEFRLKVPKGKEVEILYRVKVSG